MCWVQIFFQTNHTVPNEILIKQTKDYGPAAGAHVGPALATWSKVSTRQSRITCKFSHPFPYISVFLSLYFSFPSIHLLVLFSFSGFYASPRCLTGCLLLTLLWICQKYNISISIIIKVRVIRLCIWTFRVIYKVVN